MKFSIDPDVLLESLSLTSLVASDRSPTVGGSSVIISAKEGMLEQLAVNRSMSIRHRIPADVQQEGVVGVDVQLLSADVASVRSKIQAHATDRSLIIRAGNSRRARPLVSLDNFTKEPTIRGDTFKISPQTLLIAIKSAKIAIIKDSSRPNLACINVANGIVVAGDGQRVSFYELDIGISLMVPEAVLASLERLLAIPVEMEIVTNGQWMQLLSDSFDFKCALLRIDYPDVSRIRDAYVNKVPKVVLKLQVSICLQIIDALKIYSKRAKSFGVEYMILDLSGDSPRVSLSVTDVGTFEDTLEGDMDGSYSRPIYLHPDSFHDALSCCKGDNLLVQVFSNKDPILFRDPMDDKWLLIQSTMAIGGSDESDPKVEDENQLSTDEEDDF